MGRHSPQLQAKGQASQAGNPNQQNALPGTHFRWPVLLYDYDDFDDEDDQSFPRPISASRWARKVFNKLASSVDALAMISETINH